MISVRQYIISIGIIIVVAAIFAVIASGSLSTNIKCNKLFKKAGISPQDWQQTSLEKDVFAVCLAAQSDVTLGYFAIIVGTAIAVGAYIIKY